MPDALLDVRGIDAFYGDFQALFGVSLRVEKGQVVAVIGANGAGKSTLLKTIAGLMAPGRGEILFDGKAIGGAEAFDVVAQANEHRPLRRRIAANAFEHGGAVVERVRVVVNAELIGFAQITVPPDPAREFLSARPSARERVRLGHRVEVRPFLVERAHGGVPESYP